MNDYLWNKTGRDDELEALEASLSELRLKSDKAPQLIAEPENKHQSVWSVFRLIYAVPVVAALLIALFWYPYAGFRGPAPSETVVSQAAPVTNRSREQDLSPSRSENENQTGQGSDAIDDFRTAAAGTTKTPKRRILRPGRVHPKPPAPVKLQIRKPIQTKVVPPVASPDAVHTVEELSKEEKYAYVQLIKALSITSSKLRLVKEKIEGPKTQTNLR